MEETNPFAQLDVEAAMELEEELNSTEQAFTSALSEQEDYFRQKKKALQTTTMLATLANMPEDRPLSLTFTEEAINTNRQSLEMLGEDTVRNQIAARNLDSRRQNMERLMQGTDFSPDPELKKGFDLAYNKLMTYRVEEEARNAMEEAAIKRIQQTAMYDPVQAKVLLDNLEFGGPDQTITDFYTKMAHVRQRMDELDEEYQQSGWGRFIFNLVTNFIPGNYNFQRTGVMGTAGLLDILAVGEAGAKESNAFYNQMMQSSPHEWAEFMAKDGEFMQSLRDNSRSWFDIAHDPGAAVEIMDNIMGMTSETRNWNNIWGAVELASVLPYKAIANATASTTRLIIGSGDVKSAVRNMANHLDATETRGVEAAQKMTGVADREVTEELSVSAIKGNIDRPVPLSEPVAAHREAAQRVAKELFDTPEFTKFFSIEELQQYVLGRVDEVRKIVGSPVKDIHVVTDELPGGQTVRRMKFTMGKKDGFGYATEGAAVRGLRATGLAGRVFQESVTRTRPKYIPESKVEVKSSQVGEEETAHFVDVTTKSGDFIPVSILVDNKTGKAEFDVGGMSINAVGPKEIRAIAAKIADEIPEIKTFEGLRVTGARGNSIEAIKRAAYDEAPEDYETAIIDATRLRGQTVTFQDMSGQWFSEITVDMPEAGWLVGKLEPEQQGFVGQMVGRWVSSAARITDPTLRGMSLEGGAYMNRAAKHIANEVMGIFRALNKTEREVVQSVFTLGNIKSKWFDDDTVNMLVERQWGRKASDKELAAYKDLRLFNDMDWELRNSVMYLDKLNKGMSTVRFKTRWGADIEDDVVVDFNMNSIPTERIYDISRNKHYVSGRNPMDEKTYKTMKNNGYVLLHLPNGFRLPEGITVNKVLVKKVDVEIDNLRTTQLAYSEGGHRMYTARYFVKQGQKGKQADTGKEFLLAPRTYRTADNIAEGNRWAAKMNEARLLFKENRGITAGELDEQVFKQDPTLPNGEEFLADMADEFYSVDEAFETVIDRDLPSMYKQFGEDVSRYFDENDVGMNGYYATMGRMYTGAKGKDSLVSVNTPIRSATDPDYVPVPDVLDPFDTLSKSLSQVSRQTGLQAYKLNAFERFKNTYENYFVSTPQNNNPAYLLTEGALKADVPIEIKNQIIAQKNSILDILRFEPEGDRLARQAWQRTAERVLGEGDTAAKRLAHDAVWWWKDKNPISSLRGFAFDMKLGMFNIGQLLIQSSTMISATALNPKYGFKGMMGVPFMHHYILKRGSEAALDNMVKKNVWKGMGFDNPDEFKEFARHAYRHGFMEMNGSHIMINNYGPGAHFGSFGEKQLRMREQARVFFYTSEIWNRLVAYRIAWGEARDKGMSMVDPQFNAEILRLADDYSMNMTRESAAAWQKGVWSIPTQFWAYNARMIEAMFGKRFTPAQRARLITANFLMAGSAGIPGLGALSQMLKENNGEGFDIETVQGVADRGVIDYINYQMTGTDVLIGERVGTGGWATDTVKALFGASEYGDKSIADLLGGATYSIAKSTSKTLGNLAYYAVAESGADDAGEITKDNLITVLKEVSTFGNLSKAMMLREHGMWKSNTGKILADDLPESTAIYAALSFRPSKADEIGYKMGYLENKEEALKDVSGKLRDWRQEAMQTGDYEKYWKKANILIKLVPVQDRADVLKRTNSITDDSFYDYVENKVAEEQAEEGTVE